MESMRNNGKKQFELFPSRFGIIPYIFLIYLALPIYYMSQEKGARLVLGYGMIVLFVIAYRQLYKTAGKKSFSRWLVLQLLLICVLGTFYSAYNLLMGFFSTFFIGMYKEKKSFFIAWACFIAVIALPIALQFPSIYPADFFNVFPFLCVMLILPYGANSMTRRAELEMKLDRANERISELVKKEERVRIARDLHDTLGHTLSLITLKSQLAAKLAEKNPQQAAKEAKEIESASRSALKQVRELVSDLRVTAITEELVQTETILKAAGISYYCENSGSTASLPPTVNNVLSMCLREGITNVVKHSMASRCEVLLSKKEGEVTLRIADNGIGLEGSMAGNGLSGLKERVEQLDGSLFIEGKNGAALTITIPAEKR